MRPTKEEQRLHKEKIIDYLNFDRKGPKRHCNKTISSGDESFSVHDCILGASSDYFKTMFSVEMKEKYEDVVAMDNVPPKRLENVLEYMYSGDIDVTEENVLEVLEDSEYTQIKDLKLFCNQFILQIVSAENCLKLRAYAQRYSLDDVLDKSNRSIAENFATVVKQKDFMELDVDDMSIILKQRNDKCEEAVFTGIIQWVNHNPLQREDLFVNLFSQIDISLISLGFIAKISKENLVRNNLVCSNILVDTFVRRTCKDEMGTEILVVGGVNSEKECAVYDVRGKQSKQFPSLNIARTGAASVKVGKTVYVVGGRGGDNNYHKNCEVIDLKEQKRWSMFSDMLDHRGFCKAGVIDDQVYVTGGFHVDYMSSCEKFEINTNKWTKIKNMLHSRAYHGTVVCNDVLYCVGGRDGDKRLASCERYDTRSGEWNEIPPFNEARSGLASVVLNGEIYAIGGLSDNATLSTVERYKPGANHWERLAPLQIARSRPSACIVENKIFVVGGFADNLEEGKTVEVYNPTTNEWTTACEFDRMVLDAAVVVV